MTDNQRGCSGGHLKREPRTWDALPINILELAYTILSCISPKELMWQIIAKKTRLVTEEMKIQDNSVYNYLRGWGAILGLQTRRQR